MLIELASAKVSRDRVWRPKIHHVPTDAKVSLAGNDTNASGDVRVFRTTSLAEGEEWSNYVVLVSIERDGSTIEKQETISLKAGESRELSFNFDGEKVASAR